MLANWKDWCRLCANKTATMRLESEEEINNIILPVMQVSLSEVNGDALPICMECYKFACKLERFKERCEQTNRLFVYLSNFTNIEMSPQELDKIRGRYLDDSSLCDGAEIAEEDLDDEARNLIDIIPMHDIVGNPDPIASEVEQWEPNEIDYEDDRPTCPSDPVSRDEKMDEVGAMVGEEATMIHEDIHNDTLYVCPHCGLQLNTKRTLNMHMVVHSDQKKYKCQYCGNEYKRSKALKAHLILHTGLRPYLCPFCDRTFANGSNCRSHKKKFHPLELAALEAAGGQKPATNIPKLENLQPKSQNTKEEAESSEELALVEVDHTRQKNHAKVTGTRPPKRTAHRITVAKRIKIAG
uniref:C2H2-type domain-containing protein n=1 Tax=Anopheles atroparvus TaxID=41427 RepID=A0A182J2L0_ANOAO